MKRVLIVKTSSLGDIVHTFPALTDAASAIAGIRFDWVVEEGYEQIPPWHPSVDQVITTAVRRWRRSWMKTWLQGEWKNFVRQLQHRRYDAVIDAQGLIKSALITRQALGTKYGYDQTSARESRASLCYDRTFHIHREQHAIDRTRQLFAQVLGYDHTELALDYGLQLSASQETRQPTVVLLHGSAWSSKQWPLDFWRELVELVGQAGMQVRLPVGNESEQRFAHEVVDGKAHGGVLPIMGLTELAAVLKSATGVVAVDTGLAHVTAALDVPMVAMYGATSIQRTGVMGNVARALQAQLDCSPCYERTCPRLTASRVIPPCTQTWTAQDVWSALQELMETR